MTDQQRRKRYKIQLTIFFILLFIFISYMAIHIGTVFNSYEHFDYTMLDRFQNDIENHIKTVPFFIPQKQDLKLLIFVSLLYWSVAIYFITSDKKYMFGKEHGTASWAGKEEIKKIIDKDENNNIVFTETEQMSLNTKKTRKNLNVLVVGGSGSGKTRFYVKPNIMQANTSYVITDPKGELLRETGSLLYKKGYKIKVFNLIDMDYSSRYNPFVYIRTENDVMKVINGLIKNTNPKTGGGNDPFWEKSEVALLQSIFYFMWYELIPEEQNFKTVMELLRYASVREEDEDYESDLDIIFKQLREEKPNHIAVRQYNIFKLGAGKTIKSILISVGVRLSLFNIEAVSNLTAKDDLELERIAEEKTALFVVIPDSDTTFNFLVSMMYGQLFERLYYIADFKTKDGRLKTHVRFILDEFANIGQIPDFEKKIATMRSREISSNIIIQNMAQLKELYKYNWESITGNCDSTLFLGGQEQSTLEYISKSLGKETIDTRNINYSKGRQGSTSYNYGIHGRELLQPDEIGRMPDEDCILLIRGMFPFYSKKYNLYDHKNYIYLYEATNENYFDYSKVREIEKNKEKEEERIKILESYKMKDFELEIEQIKELFENAIFEEDISSILESELQINLNENYIEEEK
ncbi:VirD4-like conjugal transfer protein, CD1115 family [Sedimentibacter sp. MB31-C6]|uniref:VirD4-like conjugal transfer protein, CD1115 family n=1 Tax=Sedimentibacter sp. MB31-C6 TaxID=3109366 RepID=UPI002DDCCA7B|nr:type IV secretory system conjugative DNA transfer family protein [Sedimentibacter sp. MB36-C1]WSI05117.1 type IV secretory system conjugative DNA transfer family protein [Sedimentibacter sp. MB36-C1]